MRQVVCTVAVGLLIAVESHAQLSPVVQRQEVENEARRQAQELGDHAKATTLGILNPDADLAFRRLGEAVRLWKKEKDAGAAPLLAEGVLLDCLGRLQGVRMSRLLWENTGGPFTELAPLRQSRAARAFDAALKIDRSLIEARMRRARLRAPKDSRAMLDLEQIARNDTDPRFAYLAAVSLGAITHASHDLVGAASWYGRALVLHPQSMAATMGLRSLNHVATARLIGLDSADPYYTYPCTVLTPGVDAALTVRLRSVVLK
jgi:hypothetical protein